ncbi:MAG: flippase-like domain-containing protein, partial [Flavobacteriales bacterium]|nr:flippase-like domain-containing protein [Flavobacteriales bacterium]
MTNNAKSNKVKELFTAKRIAIPILIGLGVAFYMLWKNTDWNEFAKVSWGWQSLGWLFVALLMMVIRDLAYMYRIRIITDKQISWRNSFDVIMLWEFASAITPSIVGGTGVALYILNKEGLSVGKSTAMVMITALFDELFYIVTVPVVILFIGTESLFPLDLEKEIFGITFTVKGIFILGYCFTLLLTIIIITGIFITPKGVKKLLLALFKMKGLRRWRHKMEQVGDDLIQTSKELKGKSFWFWFKAFATTMFSWTARFWVVNFLILAFTPVGDHLLIYGRQLVMWIIMLISPTPGGTGIAEFAFEGFLAEFTPFGLAGLLAVLWRLLSYYPYVF